MRPPTPVLWHTRQPCRPSNRGSLYRFGYAHGGRSALASRGGERECLPLGTANRRPSISEQTRTFTVTVHREPRLGDLIEATPAQGSPAASRSSPISVFIFVSPAPTSATRVLDPDERVGGPTGGTDGVLRVPQRGSSRPQKSTSPDWSACPWRCGGQLTILCPGTSGTRKGFAVVRIAGILHGICLKLFGLRGLSSCKA